MPVLAATATYDSYYMGRDAVYATAQAATAASNQGPTPAIGQESGPNPDEYFVWRGGLFFDTSSIPSDAAVISATLAVRGLTDSSVNDFDITVVNGSALSNPRAFADYGGLLAATASGGIISSTAWSLIADNEISLNAVGLGFITKAGTTKLALRSSKDISATPPTFGNAYDEWVECYGIDAIYPAKLTVSYEAKGNLFVKAERLHYVSYTGVERYIQGTAV